MIYFLLILIIIACALLVLIILAQNPKGGGLTNIGAGASQFLGARQAADFLEKSTWYFGIGILAIVVLSYFLTVSGETGVQSKVSGAEVPISAPTPGNNRPAPGNQQGNPQQGNPQGTPGQQGQQPQGNPTP